MPLPITALYLAVFAVFAGVLAVLPGRMRGAAGVSVGDGGRADLLVAMRRHANFIEWVPYFMLMFAVLELNGASAGFLHGIGIAMILARVLHAIGLKETIESIPRGIGALGTFLLNLTAAGALVRQFLAV